MRSVRMVLIYALVIYGLAAGGLFVMQRQMMYFPTNVAPPPERVGLEGVEVVALTTPDEETVLLWHSPAHAGQPSVLFLHGNGREVADRADRFAAYQAAGFGVTFLSWRGYGGSTGRPTETGFLTDGAAALTWLVGTGVEMQDIVIIGESLGTGVAVQLAAGRDIGALVLGAPFTATVDVAARSYPWAPVRVLMKDQFLSRDHIADVRAPILIQHGTEDRVVPFDMGRTLSEMATAPVEFVPLTGKGHEGLYEPAAWEREISFIQKVLEVDSHPG